MTKSELEWQRIKRFLRKIRTKPFVAIVIDGDDVHLYSRDMSPEMVRQVREVLAEIQNEE